MAHLTDFSGQNHFARLLQGCDIAIGQVDHIDDARLLGGVRHFGGFLVAFRQRLLAEDMLARTDQRQRGRMMDGIRRHIGRGIEPAPFQRILKPREAVVNVVVLRKRIDAFRRNVAGRDDLDAIDRPESFGVVLRHAACTQNKKTHVAPQR